MGNGNGSAGQAAGGLKVSRRALVGKLWLRGFSVEDIAQMVRTEAKKDNTKLHGGEKTTANTVHHDIVAVKEYWTTRTLGSLDARRSEQLAVLQEVIAEAWKEYQKSTTGRHNYLRLIADTIDKIAVITGTHAPTRVDAAVIIPQFNGQVKLKVVYDEEGDSPTGIQSAPALLKEAPPSITVYPEQGKTENNQGGQTVGQDSRSS